MPQPSSNDAIRVTSGDGIGIFGGISEPVLQVLVSMKVPWTRDVGVVSGERGYGVIMWFHGIRVIFGGMMSE